MSPSPNAGSRDPDHGCAPSRRARGFSLIELVVVLIILATMSAIAAPRYAQALERYRVSDAARKLVADLTYARRHALLTGQPQPVHFDIAQDRYVIPGVLDFKTGSGPYVIDLGVDPYRCSIVSAVFDAPSDPDDDPAVVIFNGFGGPDSGGTIVIGTGDTTRSVVISAETGEASIP